LEQPQLLLLEGGTGAGCGDLLVFTTEWIYNGGIGIFTTEPIGNITTAGLGVVTTERIENIYNGWIHVENIYNERQIGRKGKERKERKKRTFFSRATFVARICVASFSFRGRKEREGWKEGRKGGT
jgi:hypothetical protein